MASTYQFRRVVPALAEQRHSDSGSIRPGSFSTLQNFLQGTVSTFTYAPSYTPLSWRQLESAFYAEDAVKLNQASNFGWFPAEFTNGWNEAYGRAANYAFDSNGSSSRNRWSGIPSIARTTASFFPRPCGIAWSPSDRRKLWSAGVRSLLRVE